MQTSYGQPDPGPDGYKLQSLAGKNVEVTIITKGDGHETIHAELKAADANGITVGYQTKTRFFPFHMIRYIDILGL